MKLKSLFVLIVVAILACATVAVSGCLSSNHDYNTTGNVATTTSNTTRNATVNATVTPTPSVTPVTPSPTPSVTPSPSPTPSGTQPTQIGLMDVAVQYNVNQPVSVLFEINAKGNGLSGLPINVYLNGNFVTGTVSGNGGYISANVGILMSGTYAMTVNFAGNAQYAASSGSAQIRVAPVQTQTPTTVTINVSPSMPRNVPETGTVSVTNNVGQPVTSGTVTLSGAASGTYTLSGSSVSFTIPAQAAIGPGEVVASYSGSSSYLPSTGYASFEILSA